MDLSKEFGKQIAYRPKSVIWKMSAPDHCAFWPQTWKTQKQFRGLTDSSMGKQGNGPSLRALFLAAPRSSKNMFTWVFVFCLFHPWKWGPETSSNFKSNPRAPWSRKLQVNGIILTIPQPFWSIDFFQFTTKDFTRIIEFFRVAFFQGGCTTCTSGPPMCPRTRNDSKHEKHSLA